MVREPLQLTALALSGIRCRLLLDLPEALGVPVAERRQLRVLGRQARRAVRRPADEGGVVDLHAPPSAHGPQPTFRSLFREQEQAWVNSGDVHSRWTTPGGGS